MARVISRSTFLKLLALAPLQVMSRSARAAQTFSLYTPNPNQNTPAKDLQATAEKIDKDTDGNVKIRVLLGGSLQIQASDISMAVSQGIIEFGDDQLYGGLVPIGGVTRLPALLRNYSEYEAAARIIEPNVQAAYKKLNVSLLATFNFPRVIFFSRAKLTSLSDLNGLKIRTYSPEGSEAVKRFGAVPVTMALPQIAPALERGIIDGLIASAPAAYVYRDLVKYIYVLPVIVAANDFVIVNNASLEKLDSSQQEIVRRTFKDVMSGTSKRMADEELDLIQKMKGAGITVTEPTTDDRTQFESRLSPYWDDWAREKGPEAVEVLKAIRTAIGR